MLSEIDEWLAENEFKQRVKYVIKKRNAGEIFLL